ncbi:MAG: HAD-IIIC family phosphatase [Rhizomicrobium sp.]
MRLPPDAARAFDETRASVVWKSSIVWGEHCTECAFPACYGTCSFYTPRGDLNCRRFEHGIERVKLDRNCNRNLTRIAFRRWGKLEGEGPIALMPFRAAAALDKLDRVGERLWFGPASLLYRLVWRWNQYKRRLGGYGRSISASDVFILEAWHEGANAWPFTLSVIGNGPPDLGLFQTRINLGPGYNRVVVPAREIAALAALDGRVTVQVEPVKDGAPPIIFGLVDFARLSRPLPSRQGRASSTPQPTAKAQLPKFKCVVWDLDNTLWQGTLVEDGIDGVALSPVAAGLVREFDRRGIVNSIASKNDPALAFAALEKFGLKDYFVFPRIGWGPKSEGLENIIAAMDVGANSFAFIDDQAFERGEIAELLPDVAVFSHTDIPKLLDNARFDVPVTAESGKRRQMYQTEERRTLARESSAMNYTDFLRACRITLEVRSLSEDNLLRIYELGQRTNQLNFSGRRYGQADLGRLMAERPQDTFALECRDKFGDYGTIGFCVLDEDRPRIESFFMSCRIQRKRVENAFFQFLGYALVARGWNRLEAAYRKTPRNSASAELLKGLGFSYGPDGEDEGLFALSLPHDFAEHDVVQVLSRLNGRLPNRLADRAAI